MLAGGVAIAEVARNPSEVPLATTSTLVYRWEGFSCLGLRTQLSEPFLSDRPRAFHNPSISFLTWRDGE